MSSRTGVRHLLAEFGLSCLSLGPESPEPQAVTGMPADRACPTVACGFGPMPMRRTGYFVGGILTCLCSAIGPSIFHSHGDLPGGGLHLDAPNLDHDRGGGVRLDI